MYSDIGYVYGVVDEAQPQQLTGWWFEAGSPTDTPNWGTFTLEMSNGGGWFTGQWWYGDGQANSAAPDGSWNENRLSTTATTAQCFSGDLAGTPGTLRAGASINTRGHTMR